MQGYGYQSGSPGGWHHGQSGEGVFDKEYPGDNTLSAFDPAIVFASDPAKPSAGLQEAVEKYSREMNEQNLLDILDEFSSDPKSYLDEHPNTKEDINEILRIMGTYHASHWETDPVSTAAAVQLYLKSEGKITPQAAAQTVIDKVDIERSNYSDHVMYVCNTNLTFLVSTATAVAAAVNNPLSILIPEADPANYGKLSHGLATNLHNKRDFQKSAQPMSIS